MHKVFSRLGANTRENTRAQHTRIYSSYILVQHTYSSCSIRIRAAGSGLHWQACVFYPRTRSLKSAAFLYSTSLSLSHSRSLSPSLSLPLSSSKCWLLLFIHHVDYCIPSCMLKDICEALALKDAVGVWDANVCVVWDTTVWIAKT